MRVMKDHTEATMKTQAEAEHSTPQVSRLGKANGLPQKT